MVFQNYALFPHMTVNENLSFSARGKKNSNKTDSKTKSRQMLYQWLNFKNLVIVCHLQLSGGQQQRVALSKGTSF